jgi:cytoskeletal protein CcmA (bactofilin family)
MSRVTINGQTFEAEGSISIINGRVIVGNKTVTELKEATVRIEVIGNLTSLTTDSSVSVTGNVDGNVDAGGSIQIGGNVQATTIDAGGSIQIRGNVKATSIGKG